MKYCVSIHVPGGRVRRKYGSFSWSLEERRSRRQRARGMVLFTRYTSESKQNTDTLKKCGTLMQGLVAGWLTDVGKQDSTVASVASATRPTEVTQTALKAMSSVMMYRIYTIL